LNHFATNINAAGEARTFLSLAPSIFDIFLKMQPLSATAITE